jgi:hypothetical protein
MQTISLVMHLTHILFQIVINGNFLLKGIFMENLWSLCQNPVISVETQARSLSFIAQFEEM